MNISLTRSGSRPDRLSVFVLYIFVFIFSCEYQIHAQVNLPLHSSFKYLKGSQAGSIASDWMNPSFDYSSWTTSSAPFHYGDGTGGTELTDMINSYSTLYLRAVFNCQSGALIKTLKLTIDYDDGFIIWINGHQVASALAPANPGPSSLATGNHESGTSETFLIDATTLGLAEGTNFIAVQCFNVSLSSSDFLIDFSLTGDPLLPPYTGQDSVTFSVSSGFMNSPFNLVMNSSNPTARIAYTLDGSNPRLSPTAVFTSSPATITIDPTISTGRPLTPAVIVRASVAVDGFSPSVPTTRTYIFTDRIKTQGDPGGGWPQYNINDQIIDLAVDSRVVNDPAYSGLFNNAMKQLPVISLVTDLGNLFDPVTGIYVNAWGHGAEWERDCSVEMIDPAGEPGFNINAGLRIRGGWSRNDYFPKHAFRLFFRQEYGKAKLYYPLFGNEGAGEFDKIDLRTEQNYAWSTGNPFNSMVREVFSRDAQGEMGQPYSRSKAYHLFLNGMYWGIYQTQERTEARYASTYFGGKQSDYDVVKVSVENWSYTIEATDGNLDSWTRLWNYCRDGFGMNFMYFMLEGRDGEGQPAKGGEVMVDIDNLIDYMLVIFYSGNFDAPTSSFMSNKGSNNFYAIDDRNDKSKGFRFFIHDSEHSLFDEAHSPGIGLYEDRVNIGSRQDNMKMDVTDLSRFHPQWLHFRLSGNAEYRIRFADRAYKFLKQGSVFSPEKGLERLNKRVNELGTAVIAESARWGDAGRGTSQPYTMNANWLPEVNKIRTAFLPYRQNIVINQLRAAGLYPTVSPPVFKIMGSVISTPAITINGDIHVDIENPDGSGDICYTTDGSDPRSVGGAVNTKAGISSANTRLTIKNTAILKARINYNGNWSPVQEVVISDSREDYSHLRITEVMYNPGDRIIGSDTIISKDLEFLEFKNTGTSVIDLSGLKVDSAVQYDFKEGDLLLPGGFFVLASDPSEFYRVQGWQASGNFKGNLANEGEEILVTDTTGKEILKVIYSGSYPWPGETDGTGYSLSAGMINPTGDPGGYAYWMKSSVQDGTPFKDDPSLDDNNNGEEEPSILKTYPNPTYEDLYIKVGDGSVQQQLKISLFDMYGHKAAELTVPSSEAINLPSLGIPGGVYILECRSTAGVMRTKIVYLK